MKFEGSDKLSALLVTRDDVSEVLDLCENYFRDENEDEAFSEAELVIIGIEIGVKAAGEGKNVYVGESNTTTFFFLAKSEDELCALIEAMPEDEESGEEDENPEGTDEDLDEDDA